MLGGPEARAVGVERGHQILADLFAAFGAAEQEDAAAETCAGEPSAQCSGVERGVD